MSQAKTPEVALEEDWTRGCGVWNLKECVIPDTEDRDGKLRLIEMA